MSDDPRLYYDWLETPLGRVLLAASEKGLKRISFDAGEARQIPENWQHRPAKLADAATQLLEYFDGRRRSFALALDPDGTPFQQRVWQGLRDIPYGATITYNQLAENIGAPSGSRAVGGANGYNPLVIIQPCHRVVAAGGKLGGFSSGLHRKKYLLNLEKGARSLF